MISGGSYNVFNGEEHLLHSIRTIRPNVDYVNIVVQFTSNVGISSAPELDTVLHQLIDERLVDEISFYKPDLSISPIYNELEKRSIGLKMAKRAGVSHFMTMDCDEYYDLNEFKLAKSFIEAENIEACAVPSYLHIKRPIWRSRLPDVTCCAFLSKVSKDIELTFDTPYPALVDPTRRLMAAGCRFYMFNETEIAMRHMNLVRKDFSGKLANSSNAHMLEFMAKVRAEFDR